MKPYETGLSWIKAGSLSQLYDNIIIQPNHLDKSQSMDAMSYH